MDRLIGRVPPRGSTIGACIHLAACLSPGGVPDTVTSCQRGAARDFAVPSAAHGTRLVEGRTSITCGVLHLAASDGEECVRGLVLASLLAAAIAPTYRRVECFEVRGPRSQGKPADNPGLHAGADLALCDRLQACKSPAAVCAASAVMLDAVAHAILESSSRWRMRLPSFLDVQRIVARSRAGNAEGWTPRTIFANW